MITADLLRSALFASVPLTWLLGVLTVEQLPLVALFAGAATIFLRRGHAEPSAEPGRQVPAMRAPGRLVRLVRSGDAHQ
ncbi:hypothetical protein ACWC2K_31925 [Streptomyces chattanoogensis]